MTENRFDTAPTARPRRTEQTGGTPNAYPTTPVPLDRGQIRAFSGREDAATSQYQLALANRGAEQGRIASSFQQFLGNLKRTTERREVDTMSGLAARNLARQPRYAGKALRDIRDDAGAARGEAESSRADRLAALDFAVNQARTDRDQELARIRADKATSRTDIERLLRSVGA